MRGRRGRLPAKARVTKSALSTAVETVFDAITRAHAWLPTRRFQKANTSISTI
jgi:hypothetical protein